MSTAELEAPAVVSNLEQFEAAQAVANAEYREAVVGFAIDKPYPMAKLQEIIAAAGRTPEIFKRDVSLARQRKSSCDDLERAASMKPRLEELRRASRAAHESAVETVKRCNREVDEARLAAAKAEGEMRTFGQEMLQLESIAQKHIRETASPSIDSEMRTLAQQIGELQSRAASLRSSAGSLKATQARGLLPELKARLSQMLRSRQDAGGQQAEVAKQERILRQVEADEAEAQKLDQQITRLQSLTDGMAQSKNDWRNFKLTPIAGQQPEPQPIIHRGF